MPVQTPGPSSIAGNLTLTGVAPVLTLGDAGGGVLSIGGTVVSVAGGKLLLNVAGYAGGVKVAVGPLDFPSHLISSDINVPVSSNLGANVTSVTPTGNDTRGRLAIVMAGVLAANTRICTVTHGLTYGALVPIPELINETLGAGLAIVNFYSAAETANGYDLFSDQALAIGNYQIRYWNVA